MFSIEDPSQALKTAKRLLTKEKLDIQLTGQSSSSPFMSIKEGYSREVSVDTKEELGDKIDKLAVRICKLAAKDSGKVRPFKPQIHQNRGRSHNRGHKLRNCQNRYKSDNGLSSRDRGQFRQGRGRYRFEQSYRRNNYMENPRNYGRQSSRVQYRSNNYRSGSYNRGRNRSRERSFSRDYDSNRTRSTSNSRSRSGSGASTNRDRIRCYKCREYNHFMRDCPTSREEREKEQLKQMFNLEVNFSTDKYTKQSHRKSKSQSFKLLNGRNGTTAFLPLNTKIDGQINNNRASTGQCLTRKKLDTYTKRQNQVR